jgi:GNAT superfamily N-acetyltransferase
MINIRRATEDDIPVILSLIKGLADYEKMSDDVVATEDKLHSTLFKKQYAYVFIAEWEDEPVGFSLYFFNYSTFLSKPGIWLEDLFVLPEYRGKGIGKALLKNLAKIAIENECGRLEWCVLDWNKPAIEFYRSLGAEPMDEWTTFRVSGESLINLSKNK